jgi:hypothetical protein
MEDLTVTAEAVIAGHSFLYTVGGNGRTFLRTNNGREAKRAAYAIISKEGGTAWIETPFGDRTEIIERRTLETRRAA